MWKSHFTETQIIGMIKEQEAGLTVAEVCRKHGISPASFVFARLGIEVKLGNTVYVRAGPRRRQTALSNDRAVQ
ncbi:MAG: transposase family protein [Cypionkella sp.]|nr:transposase family protein [Cypionkella sp.]